MTAIRRLFKSSRYAPAEAKEILQAIFVSEIISPSREFWVVSPWISDLPIIDNTAMTFSYLDPTWGARQVTLSELLTKMAEMGSVVFLVTRPDELNRRFLRTLRDRAASVLEQIRVQLRSDLHEKGVLSDWFHLGGSMNLTYRGVEINEEALILSTDADTIARVRQEYHHRYAPGVDCL